jgi:hypothetical protein
LERSSIASTRYDHRRQAIRHSSRKKDRPCEGRRGQIREGRRFTGLAIEFFFVRPAFNRPGRFFWESIARVRHVCSRRVWRLHWKRADGKWHGYLPRPEVKPLAAALRAIDEDA